MPQCGMGTYSYVIINAKVPDAQSLRMYHATFMVQILSRYCEYQFNYKYKKYTIFVLTSISYISIILPRNE